MARTRKIQTNFGAGELAPDYQYRIDTTQYAAGAKALTNCRLLVGGGVESRPGSVWLVDLPGECRLFDWVVDENTKYIVALSDGRFDAYQTNGVYAGTMTGCPWDASMLRSLSYAQSANTAFIAHRDFPPQRIVRTSPTTWSIAPVAFAIGPGGRPEQPYYKFADPSVTIQPSGRFGDITLTASEPIFVAGHVGVLFRWAKRAMFISAVTSPTTADVSVLEELPLTQRLDLDNTMGFSVGDIVEGDLSGARGQVVRVDLADIDVVLVDALTPFYTATSTEREVVIGPTGSSKLNPTGPVNIAPAAYGDWDEQVFSPVRGYPGAVEIHRSRLCFAGHKSLPGAFIASKPDNLYDFRVGDGSDGDAIFEQIGDVGAAQIVQMHSSEQLVIMTDRGPYYIPETPANPFRPSGIAFFPFGQPWPIGRAKARAFDGGLLMVSGSLVIKARPTGDTTRAWAADEVSVISSHLYNAPHDLAVVSNFGGGPERYAFACNEDGTLAVMQLVEAQEIRNVTPWATNGSYRSVACTGGDVFVCVRRTINGSTVYLLERFDAGVSLDAARTYADVAALDDWAVDWGTTSVQVVTANLRYALGPPPYSLEIDIPGPFHVGMAPVPDFAIETLPPIVEINGQVFRGEPMRVVRLWVESRDSARFAARGMELMAYQVTDQVDQPPPLKNGAQMFEFLGWKIDPTVRITRAEPLPIRVLGLKMEVAV